MSGDPELDQKIAEVSQFLSKKLLRTEPPDAAWLAGLRPETRAKIDEDIARIEM
jgi:hypothetical protein